MAVDVKAMVDKVVNKAKSDPEFMEKLKTNPEKAIESVIGVDIPDGMVDKVMAAVKTKGAVGAVGNILEKIIK